jgi:uncharacterized membrane protein
LKSRRGQSILYVILLMPAVLIILSLTVDVGQLQFQRLRLRHALDLATLSGAASVDQTYYARTGQLRLDPEVAMTMTRNYLQRNLVESLGERQAAYIADTAELAVVNVTPASDPFTGIRLDRPSVSARIRVPFRLSLIGFLGGLGRGSMNLTGSAQIRS